MATAGLNVAPSAGVRSATRFFWIWLLAATTMSVTGNVAHAVLNAPAATVTLAALAALVAPSVLLASTHSVALLVRARPSGGAYWSALLMTVSLAGGAFVLSFEALRSLATTLGWSTSIAWLLPCVIDVSIAQSTLCLLSRHSPARSERDNGPSPASPGSTAQGQVNGADGGDWLKVAATLVDGGVTTKDIDLVAAVLAARAAGTPPSTISRRHRIHHTTVGRILAAATPLSGGGADAVQAGVTEQLRDGDPAPLSRLA